MTLYLDTSALVKLVLLEEGSDLAMELWGSSSSVASSVLAYPEGRAALAAAHRSHRLTASLHQEAVKGFDQVCEALITVGIDRELTRAAGNLAADFELCGYDAVHLATALSLEAPDVALVSWDQDLCRAATKAGLAVISE